jgi:hypothetical protein
MIKLIGNKAMRSTRRQLLKTMMATGIATPLSMGGMARLAHAADSPKLKVVFAVIPDGFGVDSYGGYSNGLWFPTANGLDTDQFQLNELSKELADYRSQSVYLKGLIVNSGTGGHNAWKYILRDSAGANDSIDLILGNQLRGSNATLKRIYSGPHATVGASWNISYSGSSMIVPETNPNLLFEKVYSGIDTSGGSNSAVASRSHLFDPVNSQIQELKSLLGASERAKLETHLDAVEQVKYDLDQQVPVAAGCSASKAEINDSVINSADYRDEVTDAHIDVLVGGMSCGSSRVSTLQIGRSADQVVIKSVSSSRNPHDCAHRYGAVSEWRESRRWYVNKVKYLLDQLARYPDPDVVGDSLLDHTLVVFTSEMADGAPEHMQDVPVTLIGGASGLLKSGSGNGRFYDLTPFGDRTHWKMGTPTDMQRVWATIARAAGTDVPYGGNITSIPNLFTNV